MTGSFSRRSFLGATIATLGVGPAEPAHASELTHSIAGLDVIVWKPDSPVPAPMPISIFPHGFHGCATQSRFLTTALAAAGYLVVAPNHTDAACDGGAARWSDRPEAPFGDPQA